MARPGPGACLLRVPGIDLPSVVLSIAGPKRPQDWIALSDAKHSFRKAVHDYVVNGDAALETKPRRGHRGVVPGQRPGLGQRRARRGGRQYRRRRRPAQRAALGLRPPVQADQGLHQRVRRLRVDHGAVVIAAITSCTNTSNLSVMLGAALLARNAVDKGLIVKPWVKTTMALGLQVVTDYYEKAGPWPYLNKPGYNLVADGCTTCIGNSGPLPDEISAAVNEADLTVVSVLSGNRTLEGRINPDVKMNYLASPPLVIAALAGTMTSTGRAAAGSIARRQ
ncbi:MAG: aconitase family protein [Nakamurella multipartita]